jgi:hypothetical protein
MVEWNNSPIVVLITGATDYGNPGMRVSGVWKLWGECDGVPPADPNLPLWDIDTDGIHKLECMSTDMCGNVEQDQDVTFKTDCTPPEITCPPEVNICVDPGSCTKTLGPWLGEATATDNLSGVASLVNDAPAMFPVGVTTVTWTACDKATNCASCKQRVNVHVVGVFDPPPMNTPFLGHWSASGFTLRNGEETPVRFHLTDCNGRFLCCNFDDVVLTIKGPNAKGTIVTRDFSLANGKLRKLNSNRCCYEAVFNTRVYSVKSGGNYYIAIKVNDLTVGMMPFKVF